MLLDALIFYKNPAGEIGTKMISSSLLMISSDRLSDFVADFRCENIGVQVMLGMPQEIQEQALDFVLSFVHGDRFDQKMAEPILDQVFICASYLKVDQLIEEIKSVEQRKQTLDFTEVEAFLKQLAPPVFLPEVPTSVEFLPSTPILKHVSMSCFRLQVPVEDVQEIGQNLSHGLNQGFNQTLNNTSTQNSSNNFLNQVQPTQNSTPSFGNSPVQFENKNTQKTGNTALDDFFNSGLPVNHQSNPQVQINSRPDFGQIRSFQSLQNNQQNNLQNNQQNNPVQPQNQQNRQKWNYDQFRGFNEEQQQTYAQSFQWEVFGRNNTMDLLKHKNDGQDKNRFRAGAQKKF